MPNRLESRASVLYMRFWHRTRLQQQVSAVIGWDADVLFEVCLPANRPLFSFVVVTQALPILSQFSAVRLCKHL
jgi:hypothetical protein